MSERWHANRMGFVNFWLFDEEVFSLDNGKILLRGDNASGKSITTQSIIPFVLDGDRSPERLDPFGSRDRKMEYYFLGENEREEATGYIFLEFVKKESGQYRTIGIGQRARKGKPMTFWGFVLLDNRRIGVDLQLYKQVGDKQIPKTKQELKNDMGEHNRFADSSREYMELVNKYIFDFPRMELYEQFIKLLIKVRAPKLSKDLKPSLVYTILNDSLQTLSDDDLSAMVDAMEQLDTMQATIDDLKETLRNIIIIRNEYDRYNRYMVGTKARAYKENHEKFIKLCNKLEERVKNKENYAQKVKSLHAQNEQKKQEIEMYQNEIEILDAKEVHQQIAQRDKYLAQQVVLQQEKEVLVAKQKSVEEEVEDHEIALHQVQDEADDVQYTMNKNIREINELNDTVHFEMELSMDSLTKQDGLIESLTANVKAYGKRIQMGLLALKKHEEAERLFSNTNEKFNVVAQKITSLKQDASAAQRLVDQLKDEAIENFHILNKKNQVLQFASHTFHRIVHALESYTSCEDFNEIHNLYSDTYFAHQKRIHNELNTYVLHRTALEMRQEEAKDALQVVKAMKDWMPIRRDKVEKTREYLQAANMQCQSFYELVEFSSDVNEEERSLLEEQLIVSGVLDALVMKEEDYEKIKGDWQNFSDVVLVAGQTAKQPFRKLTLSDPTHALANEVMKILACISEDPCSQASIIICPDGFYKHGLLQGHCTMDQPYCYVGALARQKRLQQEIAIKEKDVKELQQQFEEQMNKIQAANEDLDILKQEYKQLPSHENLDEALALLQGIAVQIKQEEINYETIEKEVTVLLKNKNEAYQGILQMCADLPFDRKIDVYEDASDACEEMEEVFQSVYQAFYQWKSKKTQVDMRQSTIADKKIQLEEISLSICKKENACDAMRSQIQYISDFLNNVENQDIIKKLEKANERLQACVLQTNENKVEIAQCTAYIEDVDAYITEAQEAMEEEKAKDTMLYLCFKEELALGYIVQMDGRVASDCMEEACACLRSQDVERSISDITTALDKNFQQHASYLSKYGSRLEDLFDDHPRYIRRRQVIQSTWLGRTVNLEEFYHLVKEEIENNELLLEKKDRELFENILSNTLSQKLSNRISESRKWIEEMSQLMEQMDTSMGLSFSLKWKPKPPENDQELSIEELNVLLRRNNTLLTKEDIEKVSKHFRSKIKTAKQLCEDRGEAFNYQDLIRDALDYRKWFEFRMRYHRSNGEWKELTNSIFNTYSGGEKAMAMYVPLFAAVNAQYKKCERLDHPRIIALDEAFAGVDERNIDVMFNLIESIDLDYIMNSQALWGCYPSVPSLHVSELLHPVGSQVVTVINYHWNGICREVLDS